MSDEFESINSRLPDLQSVIANRVATKKAEAEGTELPPAGTVDPYQLMLKRKAGEPLDVDTTPAPAWPEESIKKLESYCQKMGIVGFNCGRMHPIAALSLLKKEFGEDFSDTSLEDRVPEGYQKLGSSDKYSPNYPYSEAVQKKQILHD